MPNMSRQPDHAYLPLRDAVSQLFAEAFTPVLGTPQVGTPGRDAPPVNIYEDGERFYVQVLAPGIDPANVEITAVNGVISISGRLSPLGSEGWRQVWQEFGASEFRRQLRLPVEFDANAVEASYRNGILLITVPKAEHTRPKTIRIKVGS